MINKFEENKNCNEVINPSISKHAANLNSPKTSFFNQHLISNLPFDFYSYKGLLFNKCIKTLVINVLKFIQI